MLKKKKNFKVKNIFIFFYLSKENLFNYLILIKLKEI